MLNNYSLHRNYANFYKFSVNITNKLISFTFPWAQLQKKSRTVLAGTLQISEYI